MPKEFHEYLGVFNYDLAAKLPEHRPQWDHKIQINDDEKLSRLEPLKRILSEELKVLQKYLKENLDKKWITPSLFEYASPILFVKKPEGQKIRVCVDYRGLNNVTKKNRYSLPLIDETITRVLKAK